MYNYYNTTYILVNILFEFCLYICTERRLQCFDKIKPRVGPWAVLCHKFYNQMESASSESCMLLPANRKPAENVATGGLSLHFLNTLGNNLIWKLYKIQKANISSNMLLSNAILFFLC